MPQLHFILAENFHISSGSFLIAVANTKVLKNVDLKGCKRIIFINCEFEKLKAHISDLIIAWNDNLSPKHGIRKSIQKNGK